MKGRIKLKNPIHDILHVIKYKKDGVAGVSQLFITLRELEQGKLTQVPVGLYTIIKNNLYCQKKRGEEIHVTYFSVTREII